MNCKKLYVAVQNEWHSLRVAAMLIFFRQIIRAPKASSIAVKPDIAEYHWTLFKESGVLMEAPELQRPTQKKIGEAVRKRNILLVVAHPDDESM
ncbi:hypothetical protein C5167_015891 [Papaver somniferum]|nr:hypothetical protein C5167_015891 [Papaver somniferum]